MYKLAVAILVLVAAGAGAFFILRSSPPPPPLPPSRSSDTVPALWIEVFKPKVSLKKENAKIEELKSGDELRAGAMVETDATGIAAIHFPDGSVTRIDSGTTVTIETASFDESSEKLGVKMRIGVGRVWSKILDLVTPDSIWEVKTTNAVATVRGTAFGIWYEAGTSGVVGSQESVTVGVLDPKTGAPLPDVAVVITPKKFVQIDTAQIEAIRKDPTRLAERDAPASILKQEWIQRSQSEDIVFDQKIETLKRQGLEDRELRQAFREDIRKEFENTFRREAPVEQKLDQTPAKPGETIEKRELPKTPQTSTTAAAKSLTVTADQSLEKVTEGNRIVFRAVLILNDGSRRNVTGEASWQVIGLIGSIDKSGTFSARLDPAVSELGRSAGSIIATWKNPSGGEPLLGKSPIFSVEAAIEAQPAEPQG